MPTYPSRFKSGHCPNQLAPRGEMPNPTPVNIYKHNWCFEAHTRFVGAELRPPDCNERDHAKCGHDSHGDCAACAYIAGSQQGKALAELVLEWDAFDEHGEGSGEKLDALVDAIVAAARALVEGK